MRMDAQETFAKNDKNRDMENRVGCQLMQLYPIDKEEAAEKIVNRSGKTAQQEFSKDYPISVRRSGRSFVARWRHLLGLRKETEIFHIPLFGLPVFRSTPSGDLLLDHRRRR